MKIARLEGQFSSKRSIFLANGLYYAIPKENGEQCNKTLIMLDLYPFPPKAPAADKKGDKKGGSKGKEAEPEAAKKDKDSKKK